MGKHNYCRNPEGKKRIYCYTEDNEDKWAYCVGAVRDDVIHDNREADTGLELSPLCREARILKQIQGRDKTQFPITYKESFLIKEIKRHFQ